MNNQWRRSVRAHIQRLGSGIIKRIIPTSVLEGIQKGVEREDQYPKQPFSGFVAFMVLALLWDEDKPATRNLAALTRNPILQRVTGLSQVSHQAIADRFQTISRGGLRQLLDPLIHTARRLLSKRTPNVGLLKIFDGCTVEGSLLLYDWAAPNGDTNAIRFAFNLDHQTDTILDVVDASDTTSANTVFPELVEKLNRGETGVFDAGFTKLVCFRRIIERGAFWIARMANSYSVQVVRSRQLPAGLRRVCDGWTLQSDEVVLVGTRRSGGPRLARRLVWTHPDEEVPWVIWTNHFSWKPKRIFQAYRARWRIEVHFRWLKSNLQMDHLPSQDPGGVEAFFLLTVLAWLFLRLFHDRTTNQPWTRFSCRKALANCRTAVITGFIELLPEEWDGT